MLPSIIFASLCDFKTLLDLSLPTSYRGRCSCYTHAHAASLPTPRLSLTSAPFSYDGLQVNEYKYEMERITRELQDAKRKHYEHKRREQVRVCGPSKCATWLLSKL